ncbi:MAG: acetyl-CoA C-acetyltransferase [Elusimicrobiota bacterium]|jgi:acetyl-CoA C-acetyltransferase
MKTSYIIAGSRTAIGSFGGTLADHTAVDLGTVAAVETLKRASAEPADVDEVLFGSIYQAGLGQNAARQIAMRSGVPQERTAMTVNMLCGSGLRTVALAAQAVSCGDADTVLAGGAESMTNPPYLLKKARSGYRIGHGELLDSMIHDGLWCCFNDYHMGVTAENLAQRYNLTREEQDRFAAGSQNKAEAAQKAGRFDAEIAPVSIPQRKGDPIVFAKDEYPKHGTTTEKLAGLKPAFKKDGTVTAANSSGINDGAACVFVASEEKTKARGWDPMARIVSYAWAGTDPAVMGIGPVEAVTKALAKAGWTLPEIDLIEANEAFAAQALAVGRELKWDPDKVNVNGGAIALGHPVGASGSRVLVTLLHEMERRKARKGLATLCVGGGMGIAMCVENLRN